MASHRGRGRGQRQPAVKSRPFAETKALPSSNSAVRAIWRCSQSGSSFASLRQDPLARSLCDAVPTQIRPSWSLGP
jgi:hypothetical protein